MFLFLSHGFGPFWPRESWSSWSGWSGPLVWDRSRCCGAGARDPKMWITGGLAFITNLEKASGENRVLSPPARVQHFSFLLFFIGPPIFRGRTPASSSETVATLATSTQRSITDAPALSPRPGNHNRCPSQTKGFLSKSPKGFASPRASCDAFACLPRGVAETRDRAGDLRVFSLMLSQKSHRG